MVGQPYTLEKCPWKRSGYTFCAWGTAPGYKQYSPGTKVDIPRAGTYHFYAYWLRTSSPIIMDLDGNGVRTTSLENGINFDFEGNGSLLRTAWADPNCGLLVRDLNGNGQIDNASELFGNFTILKNGQLAYNGFEALAELDLNGDGEVDRAEAEAAGILIWKDANTNGIADSGEMLTFEEAGVLSIQTRYVHSREIDENGNMHRWIGTFTRSDGTKASAIDVLFNTSEFEVSEVEVYEIADILD